MKSLSKELVKELLWLRPDKKETLDVEFTGGMWQFHLYHIKSGATSYIYGLFGTHRRGSTWNRSYNHLEDALLHALNLGGNDCRSLQEYLQK